MTPFRTPDTWRTRYAKRASMGTMDQVLATIANVEKSKNGLNNPGNVIYVGQTGASPSSNCFTDTATGKQDCIAHFDTIDNGVAAETSIINSAAAQGLTIAQFTAKYAPSGSGNDPAAYAQYIAQATGLSVDAPLSAAIAAASNPGITTGPNPPASNGGTVYYTPDSSAVCDPGVDPTCGVAIEASTSPDWTTIGILAALAAVLLIATGR